MILSHSEVVVLSMIKGGLLQTNPLIYRLMTNEKLLRYQAWNVVNGLITKGLIEKGYYQKRDRVGRLRRVQVLLLTKRGEEMFVSS